MTFAAFLRNYRRILALLIASALLHLLVLLVLADAPPTPTPASTQARLVIAARLAPLPGHPPAARPASEAPAVAPANDEPQAPVAPPAAARAVRRSGTADAFAVDVDAAASDAPAAELPGSRNTRLPPSANIRYGVEQRAARSDSWTSAGSAALSWQHGSGAYTLAASSTPAGAQAPSHTMTSEGIIGDAGILPLRARDKRGGGTRETVFDREQGLISFSGSATTAAAGPASQDPASMLVQLAAMANADPDQLEGGVDVHVGGPGTAGVVRFEKVGMERIETPMGAMQALHLAQRADAGRARVELWLAQEHGYLPVRMVTHREDGSVVRQSATSITR